MSHFKERAEKNCLNCNAEVQGRYCQVCGQENVQTYETAWHLVKHFFEDITHYDGKFISSLKYVLFRPGFLSKEYIRGRRASYLNPIRMYIFTSAVFFLLFFTLSDDESVAKHSKSNTTINGKSIEEVLKMDSVAFAAFTQRLGNDSLPMTRDQFLHYTDSVINESRKGGLKISTGNYRDQKQYDSLLDAGKVKHNWLQRYLIRKGFALNEKYHNDRFEFMDAFKHEMLHNFPKLFIISLPLFALLLQLLYKRRKQWYYAAHVIFTIHFYVFAFIMLSIDTLLSKLTDYLHASMSDWISVTAVLIILYYLFRAMRNFYEQSYGKTVLKYVLLNILNILLFILLFFWVIIFSFFKM